MKIETWTLCWAALVICAIAGARADAPPVYILSSAGLGEVKIGMSLNALEHKLGKLEIDKAQDPTGHCVIGFLKQKPKILYMLIGGVVSRIDVGQGEPSNIATITGIRLGSSAVAVQKAYSDSIEKREGQGSPQSFTLLHMDGGGETNGVGFYIESGKVTWLMSGTHSALLREESCL